VQEIYEFTYVFESTGTQLALSAFDAASRANRPKTAAPD